MDKPIDITQEHVMRCQVTGGFIEVRFRHEMTAEDIGDLVGYLEVWESHLAKRPKCVRCDRAGVRKVSRGCVGTDHAGLNLGNPLCEDHCCIECEQITA